MKHLQICVIGVGRFGRALVAELIRRGCRVSIVDSDPAAVDRLADSVDFACLGDVSDASVLRNLRLERFDFVYVAVGKTVMPSLAVANVLKDVAREKLACRVVNESHRFALERVGCGRMIEAEAAAASTVVDELIGTAQC